MRILALVVVVWSFVGMPMLCRAGVLVACCASGVPGHERSHEGSEAPCDHCSCDSSGDSTDDTESSDSRDCDACAESCNVVSLHSKQSDGDDLSVMPMSAIVAAPVSPDGSFTLRSLTRGKSASQLAEPIPISPSDQPLMI